MKKLTVIIVSAALLLSTSSFAGRSEVVSKAIKTSFQKSFASAENVSWKKTDDFYFANFQMEKTKIFAAYKENGDLIAISRTIEINQLPLRLAQALKEKYSDYYLPNNVIEMVLEGQTSYYINAESKTRSLQLKCYSDGDINVEKKTKK